MMNTKSTKVVEHYSWAIDSSTGDYIVENGDPRASVNLDVPIYIRLKAHRTKWLYAPDTDYGSDFYLARKHQTTTQGTVSLNLATAAIRALLDDGRATSIDFETAGQSRHGEKLVITYKDLSGKENEFILSPIG